MQSFISNMFVRNVNVAYDILSQRTVIVNRESGEFSSIEFTEGDESSIKLTVGGFEDMTVELPAVGVFTNFDDVKVGDIVLHGNEAVGWVIRINKGSLRIVTSEGKIETHVPKVTMMLGTKGIMVVKNFITSQGGNNTTMGVDPMMMMLMMSGKKTSLRDKLPMLMMAGGMNNFNPILLSMLFDNEEDDVEPSKESAFNKRTYNGNGLHV